MRFWKVEVWNAGRWRKIESFTSRRTAEEVMRRMATLYDSRCRVINPSGKAVVHCGVNKG